MLTTTISQLQTTKPKTMIRNPLSCLQRPLKFSTICREEECDRKLFLNLILTVVHDIREVVHLLKTQIEQNTDKIKIVEISLDTV